MRQKEHDLNMTERKTIDQGLKMLFLAEVVAAGMTLVTVVVEMLNPIMGLFGMVALALRIASLSSMRRIRPEYGAAFIVVLLQIGVSVVGTVLGMFVLIVGQEALLSLVLLGVSLVNCMLSYMLVRYVCIGTSVLLEPHGNEKALMQGDMAKKLFLVVAVIVSCSNLLTLFPLADRVFNFTSTLSGILTTAAYFVYARFLYESRRSFLPATKV